MTGCCDELASGEQDPFEDTEATLSSSFSRDSLITIEYIQFGETSTISGNLRLRIGDYTSEPFALDATANEVKNALHGGGVLDVDARAM